MHKASVLYFAAPEQEIIQIIQVAKNCNASKDAVHHGLVAKGSNKDKVELIMAPTHTWATATFGWGAILPKCKMYFFEL